MGLAPVETLDSHLQDLIEGAAAKGIYLLVHRSFIPEIHRKLRLMMKQLHLCLSLCLFSPSCLCLAADRM